MENVTAQEALNEIRQASRVFKAFEHVEKVLAYMAGVEQNERELKIRITALREEIAKAEQHAIELTQANQQTVKTAKERAEQLLSKATAEAAEVVHRARSDAMTITGESDEMRQRAKEAAAKSAEQRKRDEEAAAAARTLYDDLQEKIKQARKQAASIIGG